MKRVVLLATVLAVNWSAAASDASFDWGLLYLKSWLVQGTGNLRTGGATAIDGENNYYVSGTFQELARFGTNLLTSSHLSDAFLAKYDAQTNFLWVRQIPNAEANSVTVAGDQAVFIAGGMRSDTTLGATPVKCQGLEDCFLGKYDGAGNLLWFKHAGSTKHIARGYGVVVDAGGNSYITGESDGEVTFDDLRLPMDRPARFFLAKCDPNGKLLWAKREAGLSTCARDITVDGVGNVYTTGTFFDSVNFGSQTMTVSGGGNVFLVKYDTDGTFVWARAPAGPPERLGCNVAVDAQGNPHVVGMIKDTLVFGSTNLVIVEPRGQTNLFLAKYSAEGDFQWVRQFRNGDFDFSNVVNVEASGVKLPFRSGVRGKSKPLANLPTENKAEAVRTALITENRALPVTALVQAPMLRLQKSDSFIVLFWSKDLTNFILEASDNLAPFPIWEVVEARVEAVGDQMAVSIPTSRATRFYRLHRP